MPPSAAHMSPCAARQSADNDLGGAGEGGVVDATESDIEMALSGAERAHQTKGDDGNEDEDGGNEDGISSAPPQIEDDGLGAFGEGGMVHIGHEAGEGGVPDDNEIGSGT
ncbi:hypothetical protein C0992_003300, partial [Termitomyces sp. T32_za158]